jgi:hypothetical protein
MPAVQKRRMAEILRIDPLGGQAGLIALECSKFGYLTSVTLQDAR